MSDAAFDTDAQAEANARLAAVETVLARACADAGRMRESVRLVAVGKTHDAEANLCLRRAGQRVFGENRVEEAVQKFARPDLRDGTELHLIGRLQSNKAREAAELFDWIHTLDRPSLAEALVGARARGVRLPRLLVQVNTGEEAQKGGVAPAALAAFLARCRDEWALEISGLMCIPPVAAPPAPHFALLRVLARRADLPELSMGMSADYASAVALGASMVRVGTALFGARPPLDSPLDSPQSPPSQQST